MTPMCPQHEHPPPGNVASSSVNGPNPDSGQGLQEGCRSLSWSSSGDVSRVLTASCPFAPAPLSRGLRSQPSSQLWRSARGDFSSSFANCDGHSIRLASEWTQCQPAPTVAGPAIPMLSAPAVASPAIPVLLAVASPAIPVLSAVAGPAIPMLSALAVAGPAFPVL